MHIQREYWRGDLIPVMAAAFIAVVGQAIILLNDFGPGNDLQGSGSARMITAAAVSKAGAIQIPSELPLRPADSLSARIRLSDSQPRS